MEERRQHPRQRVFKGGKIFFNDGRSTVDCLVRNVSTAGARLKLESTRSLPDDFELLINQEGQVYPAHVIWRDLTDMGIRFTDAPRGSKFMGQPEGLASATRQKSNPRSE